MSTLVGLIHKKEIWMASDSRTSSQSGEVFPCIAKKIFRNGEYLIGFVGSVRGGQILFPEYFKPPKNVFDLPDAIREQCIEKGCLGLDEHQMSLCSCNYIIAYKKRLYRILIDFQMTEIKEYAAVGSGDLCAYGSLKTTSKFDLNAEERLKLAIEASKEFDASTGGKIQIVKY